MSVISVYKASRQEWNEVCGKVNKAVVFLDNASAESLHWHGGAMLLFNAGAHNVKEFSSFECGGANDRKAVFVVSGPLSSFRADIIRDILQASSFQYVIVVSSLSPAMHTVVEYGPQYDDEARTFYELEEKILKWMGSMNYTVEVTHIPVLVAPVCPQLFLLPSHGSFFPMLPTDIQHIQKQTIPPKVTKNDPQSKVELDFTDLPRELQLQLKLLVCSLNSLLEQLNIAEDCYSLGATSRIIASELAALPWARGRRKAAQHKASLLLVDRSLDLASAIGHHSETLLDRILALLPRLPGHNNDVCVNMAPLCAVSSNCGETVIVPGCLSHPADTIAATLLSNICTAKHKESTMEVNRQLVEAASSSGLPLKLAGKPGRVTPDQLHSTWALFKEKTKAVRRHSGVLQVAGAVVEALHHPGLQRLDSLLGVEKGLLQTLADEDGLTPLAQITHTINKERDMPAEERLYSVEDLFTLMVYLYSLAPSHQLADSRQENILQSALLNFIIDQDEENLPGFLMDLVGSKKTEETVSSELETIFDKLRGLISARNSLKHFNNVYDSGDMMSPGSLKPLLKQVAEAIFHPSKTEIPDIEYKSTGFRDLLKSGFGLFMNVSKPRPSDHPLLLIFVVGGVTSTELRQIKETLSASKTNIQVIVGSTSLLKPEDLLQRVLVQDNLHPQDSS